MDLLKQLNCHLAGLLGFANGQHPCSSELDEEFLCCCERARHAIRDFIHQGPYDGKVSDCFPVALDALRDLQWCLGEILRNGYERYEFEPDLYIRDRHEIETDLKEFECQLVKSLQLADRHITLDSWSTDVDFEIFHYHNRALCAIKDFTCQGHHVALDALWLYELQQGLHQLLIEDEIETTKYGSFWPRFFKGLPDAIGTSKYPSKRLALSVEQIGTSKYLSKRLAEQADQMKRQANQIETRKYDRSLLHSFFKRRADENDDQIFLPADEYETTQWLPFLEKRSNYRSHSPGCLLRFLNRLADQIHTRKYGSILDRFRKIEMFHIRHGRDPTLLHKIERTLHSLELPATSNSKRGRSVMSSSCSGSAHQLPPGLNVDDLGDIRYLRDLGAGCQGIVYKAVWGPRAGADLPLTDDLGDSDSNRVYEDWGQLVAVKEVHSETRSEGLEALEAVVRISSGGDSVSRSNLDRELDVLKTLNHPNIVELKGYTRKPRAAAGNYGLVMELLECSLEKLIESEELSELAKVDTLLQVARGMHFLHRDVGIMHRDLKPANILIKRLTCLPDDARRLGYVVAKLADFGLSKGLYSKNKDLATADGAGCHTYKRGTSFYMAPEVRLKSPDDPSESHYAKSADVFSFGTTCFNVLTGEDTPFIQEGHPLTRSEFYRRIDEGDLDPFVIQYRQSKIAALVTKCWCFDPANRPDFFEICQILEKEKRRILCRSFNNTGIYYHPL